uniref:SFRICE_030728 n=1 Tax=Spodoptera frugiperda TaxID=7108 RepID=A0A2H1WT44_SPOFR
MVVLVSLHQTLLCKTHVFNDLIDFCIHCDHYAWFSSTYGHGNRCKSGIFASGGRVSEVLGYAARCITTSYPKRLGTVSGDGKCSQETWDRKSSVYNCPGRSIPKIDCAPGAYCNRSYLTNSTTERESAIKPFGIGFMKMDNASEYELFD